MKKFVSPFVAKVVFALVVVCALLQLALAAERKDARVTQTIRDVRLLASKAAARPAVVNDPVREGMAVRTGADSRAELTFSDQTLTRLGANTVFSYGDGGRDLDLASGALLLCVPKGSGPRTIKTTAATAAVTGGVAMGESSRAGTRIIVVEGEACVKLTRAPHLPCQNLHPGDMLLLPPGATRFPQTRHINLQKLINTAGLVNGFHKLPAWALNLINSEVDNQENSPEPGGGYVDPTGVDSRDQRASDRGPNDRRPVVHPPGPLPPPPPPPPTSG